VTDMSEMFDNCINLNHPLNWKLNKKTIITDMFNNTQFDENSSGITFKTTNDIPPLK
jgi:hypothetical protein